MTTAATYDIVYVIGVRAFEKQRQGAPSEGWMIESGKRRKASFVIRYFPSRKGWRVLDIRAAQSFASPGSRPMYTGQVRGDRYWPNKDSAIMYAISSMAGHSSTA